MKYLVSVHMNNRPMNDYIRSVSVVQRAKSYWLEFSIQFNAWSELEDDAAWDIFGAYDPATPRQEILIRGGVLAPDRDRAPVIDADNVPTLTVKGYSRVWLMHRRRPQETIVLVPGTGIVYETVNDQTIVRNTSVEIALSNYNGPLGKYFAKPHMNTMHDALRWLCNQAGVNVDIRIPNYPIQPIVLNPTKSYWSAIKNFIDPWSPELWYRAQTNTLSIIDPLASRYRIGRTMTIAQDRFHSTRGIPVVRKRIGRVIVSVPRAS